MVCDVSLFLPLPDLPEISSERMSAGIGLFCSRQAVYAAKDVIFLYRFPSNCDLFYSNPSYYHIVCSSGYPAKFLR